MPNPDHVADPLLRPLAAKSDEDSGGGTAVAEPPEPPKPKPKEKSKPQAADKKKPTEPLPPWRVLLHNDDKNTFEHVTGTIVELTPLKEQEAKVRVVEAHKTGVSLLLVTHKERAELYQEQFKSKSLIVTIEPAE